MSARDAILAKLQQATAARTSIDTLSRPDFSVMQRDVQEQSTLVQRFIECITQVNGEVIMTCPQDLGVNLQEVLRREAVKNLLLSPKSEFKAVLATSVERVTLYDSPIESWKTALFNDVDAAITETLGGIAETGSLVLWPSADEPRLMSLVPPIHIAILHAQAIQPTFWHFMHAHQWQEGMPTNALLISGPSKTADIEQTLAYGVHGPKALIVMLVQD